MQYTDEKLSTIEAGKLLTDICHGAAKKCRLVDGYKNRQEYKRESLLLQ